MTFCNKFMKSPLAAGVQEHDTRVTNTSEADSNVLCKFWNTGSDTSSDNK